MTHSFAFRPHARTFLLAVLALTLWPTSMLLGQIPGVTGPAFPPAPEAPPLPPDLDVPLAVPAPAEASGQAVRTGLLSRRTSKSSGPIDAGEPSPKITISAHTPLEELLPAAPNANPSARPLLGDDLSRVPEIRFEGPAAKTTDIEKAREQKATQLAKVAHLNKNKTDGFMQALLGRRPDLAGLPMAMGDACRTKGDDNLYLQIGVQEVRQAMQTAMNASPERLAGKAFWDAYPKHLAETDTEIVKADWSQNEAMLRGRVAALMQMLAPEAASVRVGLAKHLSTLPHVSATQALAKLAIFSAEDEVRAAALDGLKVRRERDYTPILMQGFRYPLPVVAKRAAEALIRLERTDLLPQLVTVLEESDPRLPAVKEEGTTVRELVKVNHHLNCVLCHAPADRTEDSAMILTGAVPIPGEDLPQASEGYNNSTPNIAVRLDVTYLRQDFSMKLPVADAHPWPELQRFDFLVRQRTLSDEEAKAYRAELGPEEPGRPSPYHRAALAALRELTGRDAEPTAVAWRRLIEMQARP